MLGEYATPAGALADCAAHAGTRLDWQHRVGNGNVSAAAVTDRTTHTIYVVAKLADEVPRQATAAERQALQDAKQRLEEIRAEFDAEVSRQAKPATRIFSGSSPRLLQRGQRRAVRAGGRALGHRGYHDHFPIRAGGSQGVTEALAHRAQPGPVPATVAGLSAVRVSGESQGPPPDGAVSGGIPGDRNSTVSTAQFQPLTWGLTPRPATIPTPPLDLHPEPNGPDACHFARQCPVKAGGLRSRNASSPAIRSAVPNSQQTDSPS